MLGFELQGRETWDWLQASPLLGVTLTFGGYAAGRWLHAKTGSPLFQPVLVAMVLIIPVLGISGVSYSEYLRGAGYISFWLGAATVALALPLHFEWHLIRKAALPVAAGVVAGSLVSVVAAVLFTEIGGGTRELQLTMSPKAATTPVSIALSTEIGGIPALTAALTILAGITGAVCGPWVLDRIGISDLRARGIAMGTVSHGIGTARALQQSQTEGAFSALCMGLSAIATSVIVPVALAWGLA